MKIIKMISNWKVSKEEVAFFHPLLITFPIIIGCLAYFSPLDVLERYHFLRLICEKIIVWFPFINKHALVSKFPQILILVLSLSLVVYLPLCLIAIYIWWPLRKHILERVKDDTTRLEKLNSKSFNYVYIFLPIVVGITIYSFWFIPGDPSFCKGCTTDSRIGLSLYMSIGLWGISNLPILMVIIFFLKIKLAKGSK